MVILIDMDDTMELLVDAWCEWINKKYETSVQGSDVTEWDICKFFPTLTRKEIFEPLSSDGFWETVKPRKDAIKYIRKLHENGDEIYVVTASDYRSIKSKFDCIIRRYFPFISWKNIIVAQNKQMIVGDVLIDDGIHNLVGGAYKKILISAPHNKHINVGDNGIIRAESWEEVFNVVQKMKTERRKDIESG